jgi:hypothetical protein
VLTRLEIDGKACAVEGWVGVMPRMAIGGARVSVHVVRTQTLTRLRESYHPIHLPSPLTRFHRKYRCRSFLHTFQHAAELSGTGI